MQGDHAAKSISKETTFAQDVRDAATLERTLRTLADGVGWQVRQAGLAGRTVTLKLRWSDFTTLTRQTTLDYTTDQDNELYAVAQALLHANWRSGTAVRLIGVGLSGFEPPHRQLGLWESPVAHDQDRRLQQALDDLRTRFGADAIQRGSTLGTPGARRDNDYEGT